MTTNRLHVVLHVPKCAGSTMEHHLAKHLGPLRFWSPGKRRTRIPLETYERKYDATLPAPTENIAAVSGHFLGRSIEDFFPGRSIVRSVILREPERFFLSLYNFRMMLHVVAGRNPLSFKLFVKSLQVDPVAHFLLDRWLERPWLNIVAMSAAQKAALLDEMLGGFDQVVDITKADELIAWHSRDLGIPEQAARTNTEDEWVRKSGWKPLRSSDLDPSDRDALAGRLNLDRYIWRRWALKEPVSFDSNAVAPFLLNELPRPIYQLRRRLARRFKLARG